MTQTIQQNVIQALSEIFHNDIINLIGKYIIYPPPVINYVDKSRLPLYISTDSLWECNQNIIYDQDMTMITVQECKVAIDMKNYEIKLMNPKSKFLFGTGPNCLLTLSNINIISYSDDYAVILHDRCRASMIGSKISILKS